MDYEKKYKGALVKAKEIIKYYKEHKRNEASIEDLQEIFPELKESEDERIRNRIYNYINVTLDDNESEEKEKWLAWLEKQAPKPQGKTALETIHEKKVDNANKVELRFHEDDWVVNHNVVYHIDKISGVYLTLSTLNGTTLVYHKSVLDSDKIHLWTIADAKDGDILVASDGSIFLFAGVDDCACKYVALTNYNDIIINKEVKDGYWETSRAVHPANKEQRDLLFQKMEEAGWKWDAEAKKLEAFPILSNSSKTINDWTEEDECYMGECISAIATKDSWSFEEKRKTKHWLKSIKQRLEQ